MEAIELKLNGKTVAGRPGMSVLELATENAVRIPTLCHHPELRPYGACRVCLVEDESRGNLVASCVTPAAAGMSILTDSPRVIAARRLVVELMLASHPDSCIVCDEGNRCELRRLAGELGIGEIRLERFRKYQPIEAANEFIIRDLSKCILCGKCVRACQEVQGIGAIDYAYRGFNSKPATNLDRPLELSNCTFCGLCLDVCPVGALSEKWVRPVGRETSKVHTVCPWCDLGCNINLHVRGDRIVTVSPASGPNGSALCARGRFGYDFVNHPDRLTKPLVREGDAFVEVSWDEALGRVAEGLSGVLEESGPDSIGVLGSPRFTNEDAYVLQRFARQVIGTNNVDCGWAGSFSGGSHLGNATGSFADIDSAGLILIIGDTSEHPVLEARIRRAVRDNGCTLALVGGSKSLGPFAAKVIKGDGDLNAAAKLFEREGWGGPVLIVASLAGAGDGARGGSLGLPRDLADQAINLAAVLSGKAIVLGGPNNVQGAYDMGLLPDALPGYAPVELDSARRPFEKKWGAELPARSGLSALEMLGEAGGAAVKVSALYVAGSNPALYVAGGAEALERLRFLVVQELFMTETARLADVVLPAASFAERDGTVVSAERRAQALRKAIAPVGESRPDWEIVSGVAAVMGSDFGYKSVAGVLAEIAGLVPAYARAGKSASLEDGGLAVLGARHENGSRRVQGRYAPATGAMLGRSRVATLIGRTGAER